MNTTACGFPDRKRVWEDHSTAGSAIPWSEAPEQTGYHQASKQERIYLISLYSSLNVMQLAPGILLP